MKKELEKNTEIMEQETQGMENVESDIQKPYTFRKLSTEDIFPMLKLMNKIGLRDLKEDDGLKNVLFMFMGGSAKGKVDVEKLGIDMFLELAALITENIPKCETELYTLLSNTSNLSVEDIKEQSPATTMEMIIDFIKKEEFADFFKVVLKLFK
jgi:hypothetical protein